MSVEQKNAEHGTHALFQNRWSPRAFDASKEVSEMDLNSCLEAARWAPSCFGEEPWRFIVCQRSTDEERWQKLLGCLAPKNQEWAQNAPVLLMVCTSKTFSHNGSKNRWAEYDAGQASVSLCLQATALGLVTHQMGGFDVDAVCDQFAIPEGCVPLAAIAMGFQGEANTLDDAFQASEAASRVRKALTDIIHHGDK